MKYRLIRFSNKEHKVELDMQVSRPDFMGCNRQWITANPDGDAVLIDQVTSKGRDGKPRNEHQFYVINKSAIIPVDQPLSAGTPTWVNVTKDVAFRDYKYLQMLELTNSL